MDASPTLSRNIGRTLWQGYSPDMSDDAIRAAYTLKYGAPPTEVLRQASIVLCGPVESIGNDTPERATGLEMAA